MNGLQWFQVLMSYAVQATLVIGIAWGMERWSACAATKSRVWTACFVSLLLLLASAVLLPRLEWLHPWNALAPGRILAVANTELVLGKYLLFVWTCGSALMTARWAIQSCRVRRFLAKCPEYSADIQQWLRNHLGTEAADVGDKPVRFRESPRELGPFCYQFQQPLIFLPRTLIEGDASELTHVLRHELMHLRTQHPLQLFLQKLVQVVLWFHPLVWVGGRRSALVREFVCDEAASGDAKSTASYLRTLLRLVEGRANSPTALLRFGRTPSELTLRAQRLALGVDRPQTANRWAPMVVCLSASLVSQLWLPTNPLASRHAGHSPWPIWTAKAAHAFGVSLRDFETFDAELTIDELIESQRRYQAK